jgi:hypothetical protein
MKNLSQLSHAAMRAVITGAGIPLAAGLSHMLGAPSKVKQYPRYNEPETDADFAAIKKAEEKRLRRSGGKNKERV